MVIRGSGGFMPGQLVSSSPGYWGSALLAAGFGNTASRIGVAGFGSPIGANEQANADGVCFPEEEISLRPGGWNLGGMVAWGLVGAKRMETPPKYKSVASNKSSGVGQNSSHTGTSNGEGVEGVDAEKNKGKRNRRHRESLFPESSTNAAGQKGGHRK